MCSWRKTFQRLNLLEFSSCFCFSWSYSVVHPADMEPLLCVIRFLAWLLPSAHTDKTAWDGKSTWITIYYGRCCFRQVLFRGNLLCVRWCYGNNLLTEVLTKTFFLLNREQVHDKHSLKLFTKEKNKIK